MPKTTSNKEYIVKEELTGGDLIEWRTACMSGVKDLDISGNQDSAISNKIDPNIINTMEETAIKIAIVSLEGKSNDILSRVEKLSATDYREIADAAMEKVAELNDLFAGVKKAQTDTGTI